MTELPDAITRTWGPNAYGELGGWLELIGEDPAEVFRTRALDDHPWIGLRVSFPGFEAEGYEDGEVVNCTTHPHGELLFDVVWPEPTYPIQYTKREGYHVACRHDPAYQQRRHRYFAHKLIALCRGDAGPAYKEES